MQPGDVPTTYADASALERDFVFIPKITLREGLRKSAERYKEYYQNNNTSRKHIIAVQVLRKAGYYEIYSQWDTIRDQKLVIGGYRLTMKSNSDKLPSEQHSRHYKAHQGQRCRSYFLEPTILDGESFFGSLVVNNLEKFKAQNTARPS